MNITDFLNSIDFDKEYIHLYFENDADFGTEYFKTKNTNTAKLSTDIEGFITITEGEKTFAFRPDTVQRFEKGLRYTTKD